jgi:hypothetical protein
MDVRDGYGGRGCNGRSARRAAGADEEWRIITRWWNRSSFPFVISVDATFVQTWGFSAYAFIFFPECSRHVFASVCFAQVTDYGL